MGSVWPFLLTMLIAQLLMMWRPNENECLTVLLRVREKQFVKSASPKLTPLHHVSLNMQQHSQAGCYMSSLNMDYSTVAEKEKCSKCAFLASCAYFAEPALSCKQNCPSGTVFCGVVC